MKLINQILSLLITASFLFPVSTSKQVLVFQRQPGYNLAPGTQTPTSLNLTPTGAPKKYIYAFWGGQAEGNRGMKALLGGKGANLAEMASMGLPVPPGFTITTEATNAYFEGGEKYPQGLEAEIDAYLAGLERVRGKKFGDPNDPLLVAVRSGAKISMPGMMETILNVGLNDKTVEGFAQKMNNPRLAWDCYRRLIQMFGGTVFDIKKNRFDHVIQIIKKDKGYQDDTQLTVEDWKVVVTHFKKIMNENGTPFPQDPRKQLEEAIQAVFRSSFGDKAVAYKRIEGIPMNVVSAVTVISMVFGNMGETSGTGVLFTRDANTGENGIFGDYLANAQGEDVVAGIRNTEPVSNLRTKMPHAYGQLLEIKRNLEAHFKDMQDTEFTIEDGVVYMLQTRTGKRGGLAAFQIAADLVKERLIDKETAVMRIEPGHVEYMLYENFDPKEKKAAIEEEGRLLTKAVGAVPAAASGVIAFSPEAAVRMVEEAKKRGQKLNVILVRPETSPEDVNGMRVAAGILTAVGGLTSHAAVVARGWGKCCIVGAKEIAFEMDEHDNPTSMTLKGKVFRKGDKISLDGGTGEVIEESLRTTESEVLLGLKSDEDINAIADSTERRAAREKREKARQSNKYELFITVMGWANEARAKGVIINGEKRELQVRANSDEPQDARLARAFGAEGIGLVRTEHMFFKPGRISVFQKMIMARNEQEREDALAQLQKFYEEDFYHMLKAMNGHPVIVRLLDPPLHEFLPNTEEKIKIFAQEYGYDPAEIRKVIESMKEANPMLGYRGVRLGIVDEKISAMQFRAVINAKANLLREGWNPQPEIEIPFVGNIKELKLMKDILNQVIASYAESGIDPKALQIPFGTMIEIPRAAIVAEGLAELADFASFGTNDLTQMTLGISRDDSTSFTGPYLAKGIWEVDPFSSVDQEGVGALVRMTVQGLRSKKPKIDIGVCGEHGGDPKSIYFFFDAGLDNVSASTMRVPVAILAAAKKTIEEKRKIQSGKAEKPPLTVTTPGGKKSVVEPGDPLYPLLFARLHPAIEGSI